MKKITFNTNFDGLNKTLQLIPESYKVNGKKFIMSDGEQSLKIKWAGNKPVVLETKGFGIEDTDLNHMKHLMEYKSSDTTGILSGSERTNEKSVFKQMLKEGINSITGLDDEEEGINQEMGVTDTEMGEFNPNNPNPGTPTMDGSGNGMGYGTEQGTPEMEIDQTISTDIPETNDSIINNAIQILKDASQTVTNQEAVTQLDSALNQFQGEMNGDIAGNEFGDDLGGASIENGQPVYSDEVTTVDDYGQSDEFDVDMENEISLGDDLEEYNIDEEEYIPVDDERESLDEYSGQYIKDVVKLAKEAYQDSPELKSQIDGIMNRFRAEGNWEQFENSISADGVKSLLSIIQQSYGVEA